jgi:hypothetical protein
MAGCCYKCAIAQTQCLERARGCLGCLGCCTACAFSQHVARMGLSHIESRTLRFFNPNPTSLQQDTSSPPEALPKASPRSVVSYTGPIVWTSAPDLLPRSLRAPPLSGSYKTCSFRRFSAHISHHLSHDAGRPLSPYVQRSPTPGSCRPSLSTASFALL